MLQKILISLVFFGSSSFNKLDFSGMILKNHNQLEGKLNDLEISVKPRTYYLTGPLIIGSGSAITFPAGTVIKAENKSSAYILVHPGGKLNILGTETNPVIITSAKSIPSPGDWGGIIICGKAPTNNNPNAKLKLLDIYYGGTDTESSSGTIQYLKIQYAGASKLDMSFAGLMLCGVGNVTKIEYVEVYKSKGDGIDIYGGSVELNNVICLLNEGDSFEFSNGWQGNGSNWYSYLANNAGIKGSNNLENPSNTPLSKVNLKNVSLVKSVKDGGIFITKGAGKWDFQNIYISNSSIGIKTLSEDAITNQVISLGKVKLTNVEFNLESKYLKDEFIGTESFYTEGATLGAGDKEKVPNWAKLWVNEFVE